MSTLMRREDGSLHFIESEPAPVAEHKEFPKEVTHWEGRQVVVANAEEEAAAVAAPQGATASRYEPAKGDA
jgi:hypothetical protein